MTRLIPALLASACLAALAPTATLAQQTVLLSVCQDGPNGASTTEEELGRFLEGTWSMTAPGTGFTTGTNVGQVALRWDAASGRLRMEEDGAGVDLTILRTADSGTSNAPFDMAIETLTPTGLTQDEIEVLTGCAAPLRYFWEIGSGSRRSWGALMFYDTDAATGFMANSAGGTRAVVLAR